MQRQSNRSADAVAWEVAGLRPGAVGLDTRSDGAPGSLKQLRNARFVDLGSVARRTGFTGESVQSRDKFPTSYFGAPINVTGDWMYGHGIALADGIAPADLSPYAGFSPPFNADDHVPIAGQAAGVFDYRGSSVVWTGDRLFVAEPGQADIGSSSHWTYDGSVADRGIPAYLPAIDLSEAPESLTAVYSATCLTDTVRVVAVSTATKLVVWVASRATGAVIRRSELSSSLAKDLVAVNSGGVPVLLWREGTELRKSSFQNGVWATEALFTPVTSFAVVETRDGAGFHLARIQGASIVLTEYKGGMAASSSYPPLTVVTPSVAPVTQLSLAITPRGFLVAGYLSVGTPTINDDFRCVTIRPDGVLSGERRINLGSAPTATTIVAKELLHEDYAVVAYAESDSAVRTYEFYPGTPFAGTFVATSYRPNSKLASHAFIVGNAPMVWLRSNLSSVHYLLVGVKTPQVAAIMDREEAAVRATNDGIQGLQRVSASPSGEYRYTMTSLWAPSGGTVGNTRVLDIDFLPPLSVAQFGESAYLSGSLVRNWDGLNLQDAGFHDYPIVRSVTPLTTGTGLLSAGQYRYRVYAVSVNAVGERFQSPALTSAAATAVIAGSMNVDISTFVTSNNNVALEVYRTEAGGTTFYLEATYPNDLTVPTINHHSTIEDIELITKPVDPKSPGVGVPAETEEFGPTGCRILSAVADRLWTAGGQTLAGTVEHSKLKESGEGAGFNAAGAGYTVDLDGRPVTSIAPIASGIAVFQTHQIYVVNGDGPDNLGIGSWRIPELRLADGAANHQGTAQTQAGVVYWGPDGPRLLDHSLRVHVISLPILSLTAGLTPSAVQVDLANQEVTWYTSSGTAVHLNYQREPRWAEWTVLRVAGGSPTALVTPDGRLLRASQGAGDDGRPFEMSGLTNDIRGEDTSGERTLLSNVGVVGDYEGPHQLRLRVYYNRSPSWIDEFKWTADSDSWLDSVEDLGTLTPAQIDALEHGDRSGSYATHRKTSVSQCRSFRIAWSDVSSHNDTLVLHELLFEIGLRPGLGRVAVNTYGG